MSIYVIYMLCACLLGAWIFWWLWRLQPVIPAVTTLALNSTLGILPGMHLVITSGGHTQKLIVVAVRDAYTVEVAAKAYVWAKLRKRILEAL